VKIVVVKMYNFLWIWLLIAIVIFCLWGEDRSQNCLGKPCQHSMPIIFDTDTPTDIKNKILYGVDLNHTVVDWRRSLLGAIFVSLILFLVLGTIPDGKKYFIVALLLFLGFYLSSGYLLWSWFRPQDLAIQDAILALPI